MNGVSYIEEIEALLKEVDDDDYNYLTNYLSNHSEVAFISYYLKERNYAINQFKNYQLPKILNQNPTIIQDKAYKQLKYYLKNKDVE